MGSVCLHSQSACPLIHVPAASASTWSYRNIEIWKAVPSNVTRHYLCISQLSTIFYKFGWYRAGAVTIHYAMRRMHALQNINKREIKNSHSHCEKSIQNLHQRSFSIIILSINWSPPFQKHFHNLGVTSHNSQMQWSPEHNSQHIIIEQNTQYIECTLVNIVTQFSSSV